MLHRSTRLIFRNTIRPINRARSQNAKCIQSFSYTSAPYIPNTLSRLGVGIQAAFTAFTDPTRDDMVAILGEISAYPYFLERLREQMLMNSTGRRILRTRPIISSETLQLDRLHELPEGTFGRDYLSFMESQGITPDSRKPVHSEYIPDEELAYIMLRYRQVHDFWHALLDLPISVEAELAVKWFEWVQTGLPSTALAALVGPLRLRFTDGDWMNSPTGLVTPSRLLWEGYVPWVVQCAGNSPTSLMNVMYEDLLEVPTEQVRKDVGILPKPDSLLELERKLYEAESQSPQH